MKMLTTRGIARQFVVIATAAAALIAIAACGSQEVEPTQTATPAGGASATETSAAAEAPAATAVSVLPATAVPPAVSAAPATAGTSIGQPNVEFSLIPIIHINAFLETADTSGANPNPVLRVPLGSAVRVTLTNHGGGGEFDIYFPDFDAKSERVPGGSTASIVFVADKAGEFPYYSTVPGRREAGLEGRIVVGEAG